MKDIPFDLAFKGLLEYILKFEVPNSDGVHLYDITDNLVQIDQYINDVDRNPQSGLMYAALAILLSSPEHDFLNNPNDP
ncbi:hypothetical protein FACS1894166_05890 [Bacilli bacterium]|nr:hypothetical protein FACS1894166_05890 [Bacilli bacterium]